MGPVERLDAQGRPARCRADLTPWPRLSSMVASEYCARLRMGGPLVGALSPRTPVREEDGGMINKSASELLKGEKNE